VPCGPLTHGVEVSGEGSEWFVSRLSRWARADVVLTAGALVGAALAATRIAGHAPAIPADAVAMVGAVPISTAEYQRVLAALKSQRQTPLSKDEERRVLDRLIDEELLIERALALDLPRRDPRIRGDVISTVIADVVDAEETSEPTPAELRELQSSALRTAPDGGTPDVATLREEFLRRSGEERLHRALAALRAEGAVRVREP
jgi:hypothetical protein